MTSLQAAFHALMAQTPPPLDEATRALTLAAAACRAAQDAGSEGAHREPGGKGATAPGKKKGPRALAAASDGADAAAARAVRQKLPALLHALCEALCSRADELHAVRAVRALREHSVLTVMSTCTCTC